jgi:hypothetical protein
MVELTTFGICVGIVLLLLIVVGLFFGPALLFLILIFPVMLSEAITGEGGTFSPNGSSKHSPLFNLLTAFFALFQVLLLASVLYGIHRLFTGVTPTETEIAISRTILTPLAVYRLQLLNGMLWLLSVSFMLMLLFNLLRFSERVKQMTKTVVFLGYILPLLMYPLAFLFLTTSRNYLTHYPDGDAFLGFFSKAAAMLYGTYLVFSQIQAVFTYVTVLQRHKVQLGLQFWLTSALSLLYKILFIYFLIRIFMSL